jgi:hypothetical protein
MNAIHAVFCTQDMAVWSLMFEYKGVLVFTWKSNPVWFLYLESLNSQLRSADSKEETLTPIR